MCDPKKDDSVVEKKALPRENNNVFSLVSSLGAGARRFPDPPSEVVEEKQLDNRERTLSRVALTSFNVIQEKDFEEWHQEWLKTAANLPSRKGKNKGKKRCTSTLRSMVSRVVESLEEKGLIEVERCSEKNMSNIRLTRAAEALQL